MRIKRKPPNNNWRLFKKPILIATEIPLAVSLGSRVKRDRGFSLGINHQPLTNSFDAYWELLYHNNILYVKTQFSL